MRDRKGRGWEVDTHLAKVSQITHGVDRFLVINSDDDAALVAKLVFLGFAANYRPRRASISAQESIGLFLWAEGGANRPDAHHEPRSGGGKYGPEVMVLRVWLATSTSPGPSSDTHRLQPFAVHSCCH